MRGVMLSEAKHLNRENRPFASLRVTTISHSEFRIRHSLASKCKFAMVIPLNIAPMIPRYPWSVPQMNKFS